MRVLETLGVLRALHTFELRLDLWELLNALGALGVSLALVGNARAHKSG